MSSAGGRRRKPKKKLPPVPNYVRYPHDSGTRWRLGGPLTSDHEAEAWAAQRARSPGRLGRFMIRVLGGKPDGRS